MSTLIKTSSDSSGVVQDLSWTVPGESSISKSGPVPGWQRKLRTGQNAQTAMSGTKVECNFTPISASRTRISDPSWYDRYSGLPNYLPSSMGDSSIAQRIKDKSETAFRASAISGASTLLGATIAELHKTKSMIALRSVDLLSSISDFARKAKAARSKLKYGSRAIADLWLEYRFGWISLTYDISGLISAFNSIASHAQTRAISEVASDNKSSNLFTPQVVVGGCYYKRYVVQKIRYNCRTYGVVAVPPNDFGLSSLGLTVPNIIPTVWEEIPFSWAVDYFTNLGSFITAQQSIVSRINWWAQVSGSVEEISVEYENDPSILDTSLWNVDASNGSLSLVTTSFNRVPRDGEPSANLVFQIPSSGIKVANLAAALRQLVHD